MKFFNLIISLFEQKYKGATDNLTEEEKIKLYQYNEIASGEDLVFEERLPKFYSLRNQYMSFSCVAQTIAKMLEIVDESNAEQYSAMEIYRRRNNYPSAGCSGDNVLKQTCELGAGKEKDIQSQNLNETQMNAYKYPNQKYINRPLNFFAVTPVFDDIARTIRDFKCAMIWVRCDGSNYSRVPVVGRDSDSFRHSITAVDYVTFKGKRYIIVEDSWGSMREYPKTDYLVESILNDGQRAFSEEFVAKHVFFARGITNFVYAPYLASKHTFTIRMEFGQTNNEIIKLQDALKKESLFPANLPSTGYYGNITKNAVYAFQIKYSVAPLNELNTLKGGRVGDKTIAKLNSM